MVSTSFNFSLKSVLLVALFSLATAAPIAVEVGTNPILSYDKY